MAAGSSPDSQGSSLSDPAAAPTAAPPKSAPGPDAQKETQPTQGGQDATAGAERPTGVEVIRVKGKAVTAIEAQVPSSVTQFDPAAIAALGAQNVSDLAKVTPNLEIRTSGATTATFFIRGVGLSDFNANAAGAVAIYQDDVAMNSPALQLGQLYDLEGVQVLRGPQGSGPGRNASAGAIMIRSRRPGNDMEATLRVDLGESSEINAPSSGFASRDFEGAVQIPIVKDVVSTRFAFRLTQADPYGVNGCSTKDWPSLADRVADPAAWNNVPVCGVRTFAIRVPNPSPPPNTFGLAKVDPVKQSKVNDQDHWAARGAIRFQPRGTEMDWLLSIHGSELQQQSTLGQAIGTAGGFGGLTFGSYRDQDIVDMENRLLAKGMSLADARVALGRKLARNLDIRPYRGDYDRVGQTALDTWGGFLRGDVPNAIDGVDFVTITGYDGYNRHRITDQDFTSLVLFEADVKDDAWQFTQDVRLKGSMANDSFRWNAGGYYLQETVNSNTDQTVNQGGTFTAFRQVYKQNTWSFGAYAGFSWDFLDDFTLEGGARYNWEEKTFNFTLTQGQNSRLQQDDRVWAAPTGTINLTYRFTPEITAFTKLSRGWKGGHFNGSANLLQGTAPAEPEKITATETGVKGSFLDSRLDLTANFFYYRYQDYQVFLFENNNKAPPNLVIVNANDAEVVGAEANLVVKPIEDLVDDLYDGLELNVRVGWLRSKFLDFTQTKIVTNPLAGGVTNETIDYSGNPLISSPEWKVNLSVKWPLDFGRYGVLTPSYDGIWTDDTYFDPTKGRGNPNSLTNLVLPKYALGQRAFWLHNVRLAYTAPGGHIELAAWVRNVEDTAYKTYAFDATAFASVIPNFVGAPRTYGMSLSFKW